MIPLHDDNPLRRVPFVTIAIIIANLLSFAWFISLGGKFPELSENHRMRVVAAEYGFVPRVLTNLSNGQPVKINLYPEIDPDDPNAPQLPPQTRFLVLKPTIGHVLLTLITSMFMHGGWMHLLGNMLFLWVFGNNIEDRLGHVAFTLFYVLGGTVAILCHWVMIAAPYDLLPTVGASGAVAVMLGAYAVTYPRARVTVLIILIIIPIFVKIPAMVVLGFWILGELMSAWLDDPGLVSGVAFWAHIGGFFTGALVMPILAAGTPEPTENWEKEAKEQFDFSKGEPAAPSQKKSSDPNRAGNWWDDIPPRRDMPVPRNDAWWNDRRG